MEDKKQTEEQQNPTEEEKAITAEDLEEASGGAVEPGEDYEDGTFRYSKPAEEA